MPVFPGLPEPSFRPIASVPDDGYAMTELHLLNHVGTHVDAPAHQIAAGNTLDDIPLERLVTHALTIDVSDRPPGPIPLAELESQLHHLHPGDILFLCSDNARNWGTTAYWTGWSYPDSECAKRWWSAGSPRSASTARRPIRWTPPRLTCTGCGSPRGG